MNKNAPSEKINPLCYQEARASTMAAWKIPTVLCFDKMGQEVMMDKISTGGPRLVRFLEFVPVGTT